MGIKELWGILAPYCDRKPLYELQGKIVAIDLAGWVCESLNVVDYMVQPKFYLRNLFFRTCYLLMSGVIPVFVLEGEAPKIKHDVIAKRNELQFMGARPKNTQIDATKKLAKKDKGRSRFNHVLKQCEQLIGTMGIQCVQGSGEAEAFCAYLNNAGMVDGVISQDSDCFAYGAIRVFRNFSVSTQGTAAASGGAVDIYDLNRVCQSIDLGPNKMVVLALLCGCDYCPEGVGGVGKDSVLKLFDMYKEHEILDVLKMWRFSDHKYSEMQIRVDDKNVCSNCGHHGKTLAHTKSGCSICRSSKGCDETLWKEKRQRLKAELLIRKKALVDKNFPSKDVIDEFLNRPASLPELDLSWQQPCMVKFLHLMGKHLQWEEIYCFQKLLPLLTRWMLLNGSNDVRNINNLITPECIKKKRTPKGIASYEIVWKDDLKNFDGIIPDEQIDIFIETNPAGLDCLWTTIEPSDLVEKAYPELVESFNLSKIKPKKAKAQKRLALDKTPKKNKRLKKITSNSSLHDLSALLNAVNEIENKQSKPKRSKKTAVKGIQMIDKFLKCPSSEEKNNTFSNLDRTQKDLELSQIIKGIVQRSPAMQHFMGMKLHYVGGNSMDLDESLRSLKLNKSHNATSNLSMDDLDLLIMKKAKNIVFTPKKSLSMESLHHDMDSVDQFLEDHLNNRSIKYVENFESDNIENSFPNSPVQSSTPAFVSKFLKRERISSKQPSYLDYSKKNESLIKNSSVTQNNNDSELVPHESHFFGNLTQEPDLFELSLKVADDDLQDNESSSDSFDSSAVFEFSSLNLKTPEINSNSKQKITKLTNLSVEENIPSIKKRLSDKFKEFLVGDFSNECIVIDDSD